MDKRDGKWYGEHARSHPREWERGNEREEERMGKRTRSPTPVTATLWTRSVLIRRGGEATYFLSVSSFYLESPPEKEWDEKPMAEMRVLVREGFSRLLTPFIQIECQNRALKWQCR